MPDDNLQTQGSKTLHCGSVSREFTSLARNHTGKVPLARWASAVLLALLALCTQPLNAAAPHSLFERTVLALQDAPENTRREFASIALSQLAEAYRNEAELVQRDISKSKKLQRWSREVASYGNELLFFRDSVVSGMPVKLILQPLSGTIIEVADQQTILTHPRPKQQSALESQILKQFCTTGFCDTLVAAPEVPIPDRSPQGNTRWQFTADGAICSNRSIQLVFANAAELSRQRKICDDLFSEVYLLRKELHWQQEHGVTIDWDILKVHPVSPEQHLLRLNRSGDHVVAELHLLQANPALLTSLIPWLRNQLAGTPRSITLQADQFDFEDAVLAQN
jgi:hypothetical protein